MLNGQQELKIDAHDNDARKWTRQLKIKHPAIKSGAEFNKLLVIARGQSYDVYVNGILVCEPLVTDFLTMPFSFALVAKSHATASRAEFERITIWSADGLPKLAPPATPPLSRPEAKTPAPFTAEQQKALKWVLSKGSWMPSGKEVASWVFLGPEKLPQQHPPFSTLPPGLIKLSGPNAKLPERPMVVWRIHIALPNADEVKNLAHLPPVREFNIAGSPIGDAGLAELARSPALQGLTALRLNHTSITDAGLEHLPAFPNLEYLGVLGSNGNFNRDGENKITGSGFKYVGQLKKLRVFDARQSHQLEPGSLAALRELKLTSLVLYGTKGVTDADMDALADMTTLTDLNVEKTQVTEAGVRKLAAALPGCKILWDGGVIN
jgi:hypothetical protein